MISISMAIDRFVRCGEGRRRRSAKAAVRLIGIDRRIGSSDGGGY